MYMISNTHSFLFSFKEPLVFQQECLEFFNIPEARSAHYFLMDKRWNLIHYSKVGGASCRLELVTESADLIIQLCSHFCLLVLKTYVRDIYPFRRSVSPQLNLVHMLPEKGQELIQKQVSGMETHSTVS